MIELRDYQVEAVDKCLAIIKEYNFAVLVAEMRTGKTLTSLAIANKIYRKEDGGILFVTKKKALLSVEEDIEAFGMSHCVETINYESLHKVARQYSVVILDEYHNVGYIAKKKKLNRSLDDIKREYTLGMTGTLQTETYSTAYSLFSGEFCEYSSFYKWFRDFGVPKQIRIGPRMVNDYSESKKDIIYARISKYLVTLTQEEAGFSGKVVDDMVSVEDVNIDKLCKILKRDKIYTFKDGYLLELENISQEMHAIAQLQSGCLKLDDGDFKRLSQFKEDLLLGMLREMDRVAVFYRYKCEVFYIKEALGENGVSWTECQEEFQSGKARVFLGQFQSVKEGVKLDSCDDIIFYSMPHSNTQYLQARQRAMNISKKVTTCHFLLTKFEEKIYNAVVREKGKFNAEAYRAVRGSI